MTLSSNRQRSAGPIEHTPDLLIAGASARPAAVSAARAGLRVATADSFADVDLCEVASATRILNWPGGVLDWTHAFPTHIPFVYVGGLENAPDLLNRIKQDRPLAGITGKLLRDLRDPDFLSGWCTAHEFRFPRFFSNRNTRDADLLVKPLRSIAGLGIRHDDGAAIQPEEYLQKFIRGRSLSAAYLIRTRDTELLGTFQQLPAEPDDSQTLPPFLYRGSITQTLPFQDRLRKLGEQLRLAGVRGLCGVDFIETPGGELVMLEINPRYTASMELLERHTGRSLIGEHLACFDVIIPGMTPTTGSRDDFAAHRGKRIVFARRSITWRMPPAEILPPLTQQKLPNEKWPSENRSFADISPPGMRIDADEPICTLFATAETFDDCRFELLARERRLLAFLETGKRSD